MMPVSFEQSPACGAIADVVPSTSLPSFVSMTYMAASAEAILDVAQITDPDVAGEYSVDLDYTATQTYPLHDVKTSMTIKLSVIAPAPDCTDLDIQTPSDWSNVVYTMLGGSDSTGSSGRRLHHTIETTETFLDFDEFPSNKKEECPLTYSIGVLPEAPFLDFEEPRTLSWVDADASHFGTYTVTVTATAEASGESASFSFTLTIQGMPCADATLTILSSPMDELY